MAGETHIQPHIEDSEHVQVFGVVYGDVHIHRPPEPEPPPAAEAEPVRNPYKALNAFTSDDEADFFGREGLTDDLLAALRPPDPEQPGDRLLAVVGASGSGKSSVVRAGLIPRLIKGAMPGVPWWEIVRVTPGERPFEILATQLRRSEQLRAITPLDLQRDLEADERGLHRLAESALADREHNARLLVLVDQFEELYTLTRDADEQTRFVQSLLAAASAANGRAVIVLTVRADFYGELTETHTLRDWLPRRQVNVGRMALADLERAIVGPAENVGLEFEPGLVARILDDVGDEPGVLPLLQFALTELYEHREGRTLTLAAYQAVGGVAGALARRAEETFAALSEAGKAAIRDALLRMVTLGEGTEDTRRRVPLSELIPAGRDQTVVVEALRQFAARRLLTAGQDEETRQPIYEVSHEALIQNWRMLGAWLDEDRDNQRLLRQITQSAEKWDDEKRNPEFLAPRVIVERAQTQLRGRALSQMERAYLDASTAHVRRNARLRGLAFVAVVVVALVMAGLAAFGIERATVAQSRLLEAWDAQSVFLADLAQQELERDHGRTGLLLALESLAHYADGVFHTRSQQALHSALSSPVQEVAVWSHEGAAWGAAWSADETRVLSWAEDGTVRVWDLSGEEEPIILRHEGSAAVLGATWSADETRVLSWSEDGTARVWDLTGGVEPVVLRHTDWMSGAAWSADETRVLSWSRDGTARVWDLSGEEEPIILPHADWVRGAAWSADETRVLSWAEDGTVRVWDLSGEEEAIILRHADDVLGAAWSADESRVLSWSEDDTVRVWDLSGEAEPIVLRHDFWVRGATWSADETRVLSWSWDGTARVWDLSGETEPMIMDFYSYTVNGAAWSADETRVLTWSEDGAVWVWDVAEAPPAPVFTFTHDDEVRGAAWSADETRVLSWSSDNTARVWDLSEPLVSLVMRHDENYYGVWGAAWSADETRVLSWSDDGRIHVWDSTGQVDPTTLRHGDWATGAAWSADEGRVLSWSEDGTVRVWDLSGQAEPLILSHDRAVSGAAWSADETRVLSWSADGTARVWDLSGETDPIVLRHENTVLGATWNADETRVLSWSSDGTVRVWDLSGETDPIVLRHDGWARGATWSADETRVLFWSDDGTVRVWDLTTGDERFVLHHDDAVVGAAWSADESHVLSWSLDGTVRLWEPGSEADPVVLHHDDAVAGAAWSADETRVLSWSFDDTVRVWDLTGGAEPIVLHHEESFYGSVEAVWSADETRVLSWGYDDTIRVWDLTGRTEPIVLIHDAVVGAAWNADESRVLSWSGFGTVRVWDLTGQTEPLVLSHTQEVYGAAWNADETRVLSWSADRTVRVWTVDIAALISIGRSRITLTFSNNERERFFLPTVEPTPTVVAPTSTRMPTLTPSPEMPTLTPLPSLTPSITPSFTPSATPMITPSVTLTAEPSD